MSKRFVAIWFSFLQADWMIYHNPLLKEIPFVLASSDHGRMKITQVSALAKRKGIYVGMAVADARIILPCIEVLDDKPELANKLLKKISLWCIRYTPIISIDSFDGLLLDISGCAHLWGNEKNYLKDIISKLRSFGYHIRAAIADTIGAAWAISRYGKIQAIIKSGEQASAITNLPPEALRLSMYTLERLHKLGLYTIGSFMNMPRSVLRRRFGQQLLLRLDEALGHEEENFQSVIPIEAYHESLPSLEPIKTRPGIEIALQRLLEILCNRLQHEAKGLHSATFKGYRIDNEIERIDIVTNHPSNNVHHLFNLFEIKIGTIEPALGIELFTLEASRVEDIITLQQTFWAANSSLESKEIAELLDCLQSKFGNNILRRYLPDEHHLPERSVKPATSLTEKPSIPWPTNKLRPIRLLKEPKHIEVTAPIPDYPPMNFRYEGKLYKVKKADACERIEAEWWLSNELHRDYYVVEDEEGKRYWLFRSGHYNDQEKPAWFIHGFFA